MARLESIANLRLAWRRIVTGQNYSYRNLQRAELESFAWAIDENLSQLQSELKLHAFAPNETTKMFIPKPSGLLRPITLLRIRDIVVFQAIANLIAERARKRHADFYFKSVFSNILTARPNDQYFFRDWKRCRRMLNLERKRAFNDGYVWMGKLDLASFFDVIDHRLLGKILSQLHLDTDIIELLTKCLTKWTLHPRGYEHGHGVPQGPIASGLLAECVLHVLDRRMLSLSESVYLRWVDDITVMSRTKRDAQKQFGRIEIICRQLGLIPTIKSEIQKVSSVEDLIVDEPSPPASLSDFPESMKKLPAAQNDLIRKRFLSCFQGTRLKKEEQLLTKLRFSLFRMNDDRRLLRKVFLLLEALPTIYDAINYYLRKFGRNRDICSFLIRYLDSKPLYYDVSATCIETLYFSCVEGQYSKVRAICVRALSGQNSVLLRSSAAKVLCFRGIHQTVLKTILNRNTDVYLTEQLLVNLCSVLLPHDRQAVLNKYIRSPTAELAIIAAYLLTRENYKLSRGRTNIHPWATPILLRFGLIRKQVIGDRVGDILRKRYEIKLPASFSFRSVYWGLLHTDRLLCI